MAPKLVVVCGPTASGKTKLGIELSKVLDGEVVSADSMQVYRGMDIGTAKPNLREREGIPHHMLDVAEPSEPYSVARYVREATACVEDILARGKRPVIVGGTGLYIESLLKGRDFADVPSESKLRQQLQDRAEREGLAPLWKELLRIDPDANRIIHPNDQKRIIRALEVFYETGKPISRHNQESRETPPRYEALTVGLSFQEREDLRTRINRRVDLMMEQGLVEEVEGLLKRGIPPRCTAMQAIGYKELVQCLEGIKPIQEGVEEIKLHSRQYGKRQLSWFRRNSSIHWILWEKSPNFSSALQDSIRFLQEKGLG